MGGSVPCVRVVNAVRIGERGISVDHRNEHGVVQVRQAGQVDLVADAPVNGSDERAVAARIGRQPVERGNAVRVLHHLGRRYVLGVELCLWDQLPGADRHPLRERQVWHKRDLHDGWGYRPESSEKRSKPKSRSAQAGQKTTTNDASSSLGSFAR